MRPSHHIYNSELQWWLRTPSSPNAFLVYSLGNEGLAMAACNDHIGFPGLVHKGLPKDAGPFDFSPHAYNPQMLKLRTNSKDYYYQ